MEEYKKDLLGLIDDMNELFDDIVNEIANMMIEMPKEEKEMLDLFDYLLFQVHKERNPQLDELKKYIHDNDIREYEDIKVYLNIHKDRMIGSIEGNSSIEGLFNIILNLYNEVLSDIRKVNYKNSILN